mmetsp:Transcript_402/g.777  ORF Transcript_402/g.777 Transcript_402/m.777 type:complete len:114 (+) Transcript_402:228-569(+)
MKKNAWKRRTNTRSNTRCSRQIAKEGANRRHAKLRNTHGKCTTPRSTSFSPLAQTMALSPLPQNTLARGGSRGRHAKLIGMHKSKSRSASITITQRLQKEKSVMNRSSLIAVK